MGWGDGQYGREFQASNGDPVAWLLTAQFYLFSVAGIAVRIHVSLIVLMASILLVHSDGFEFSSRIASIAILFCTILLHEFGHCFATRRVGGSAHEIVMGPLGGLAMVGAPRRPWPEFVSTAGGPAVNVLIGLSTGMAIWLGWGIVPPLNPFGGYLPIDLYYNNVGFYLWWIYSVNRVLFYFNLLPILPMDGGRMLFAAMWPRLGMPKAWYITAWIGMIGAVMVVAGSFATGASFMLLLVMIGNFQFCAQQVTLYRSAGPEAMGLEEEYDYMDRDRPRKPGRFATWRARRKRQKEATEEDRLDAILAKVSEHGMGSLSWREKRILKKASLRLQDESVRV